MSRKTVGILLGIMLFLILVISTTCIVDLSQVLKNEEPKFCFSEKEYNNNRAVEYKGLGYKIIKYKISEIDYKVKIGTWMLKFDNEYCNSLNNIDINGTISNIEMTNKGAYKLTVVSEPNIVYLYLSSATEIVFDNGQKAQIKDLTKDKYIEAYFGNSVNKSSIPLEANVSKIIIKR